MAEIQWTVEGRRFRSQAEYQAALRDKELIDSITGNFNLENPKDIEKLYTELRKQNYQFESIVGRQFDDNIYELYHKLKEKEALRSAEKERKKEKKKQERQNLKAALKGSHQKNQSVGTQMRLEDFDQGMQQEILHILRKKEKA